MTHLIITPLTAQVYDKDENLVGYVHMSQCTGDFTFRPTENYTGELCSAAFKDYPGLTKWLMKRMEAGTVETDGHP